jgi:hypothetical protein
VLADDFTHRFGKDANRLGARNETDNFRRFLLHAFDHCFDILVQNGPMCVVQHRSIIAQRACLIVELAIAIVVGKFLATPQIVFPCRDPCLWESSEPQHTTGPESHQFILRELGDGFHGVHIVAVRNQSRPLLHECPGSIFTTLSAFCEFIEMRQASESDTGACLQIGSRDPWAPCDTLFRSRSAGASTGVGRYIRRGCGE